MQNPITFPFKDRLLLENSKLLSQLLIERHISVKDKESNPFLSYLKRVFERINVTRSSQVGQQESRKKEVEFV